MSILRIRDADGNIREILSIRGEPGKDGSDGYTPQKGVDYYTPEEKAELVEEISQTVTGDIETALDGIIAIQNELIGGDVV